MRLEMKVTPEDVKRKLSGKFMETLLDLGEELDENGRDAFEKLFELTAGTPTAGVDQNWRRDHGFLYEVTERIARRAVRFSRKDKAKKVTWRHVARAANCLIPDISYYCHKEAAQGSRFETKGPYCVDFDDMPENPT